MDNFLTGIYEYRWYDGIKLDFLCFGTILPFHCEAGGGCFFSHQLTRMANNKTDLKSVRELLKLNDLSEMVLKMTTKKAGFILCIGFLFQFFM